MIHRFSDSARRSRFASREEQNRFVDSQMRLEV
jgi:hypothetical protein